MSEIDKYDVGNKKFPIDDLIDWEHLKFILQNHESKLCENSKKRKNNHKQKGW